MKNVPKTVDLFYFVYHEKLKKKLCFLDQEKDFGFRNKVIHKRLFSK